MNKTRSSKFPLRLEQTTALPRTAAPTAAKTPASVGATRPILRPQAPLAHVAQLHRVAAIPSSGLGMDSVDIRRRMVAKLQAAGLRDSAVLAAMGTVPRHLFVDSALVTQAYEDTSLPIGHGQTISKPSVVGRMIELLMAGSNAAAAVERGVQFPLGRVLEIGTGCGYQAAVLALLGQNVVSVERLKPLHDKARHHLSAMRSNNLRLVYGDGMLGHAPNAPYDSIIAAAGGQALPEAWLNQLAVGGRLVAPVAQTSASGRPQQALMVLDRTPQGLQSQVFESVLFVPLKSGLS